MHICQLASQYCLHRESVLSPKRKPCNEVYGFPLPAKVKINERKNIEYFCPMTVPYYVVQK